MKNTSIVFVIVIVLAVGIGRVRPAANAAGAPKAEDDFQLVKVNDGVFAAIAKPGGLASGNAGFVIGDDGVLIFDTQAKQQLQLPVKYKSFAFQKFATPNVEDMYKELKGTKQTK